MIDNFLSIHDLTMYEFNQILELADKIKRKPQSYRDKLKNRILAMIFQKPSWGSRMTFEVGMLQLGGQAVCSAPSDIEMETTEIFFDTIRDADRWVDGIAVRASAHADVRYLAKACRIPVINAATDLYHPCQAMADYLTLREKKGGLSGLKLAYVGEGDNVCHSLLMASAKAGMQMAVASPSGYAPDADILRMAEEDGKETGFRCHLTSDPIQAVRDADVVYSGAWPFKEKEDEKERIAQIFKPFQVNSRLIAEAHNNAILMHCHSSLRGREVTTDVIDSNISIAQDQAENRLHVQKTVLLLLLGDK
ncbi:MAG: ornithine carbamoyltransferase [Candidatus Aminicenantes bacterium]|nr:ornithine carbamoyltransferase [Candidatus Aminicenantes bacterium]